jgi:hypothetical protein
MDGEKRTATRSTSPVTAPGKGCLERECLFWLRLTADNNPAPGILNLVLKQSLTAQIGRNRMPAPARGQLQCPTGMINANFSMPILGRANPKMLISAHLLFAGPLEPPLALRQSLGLRN